MAGIANGKPTMSEDSPGRDAFQPRIVGAAMRLHIPQGGKLHVVHRNRTLIQTDYPQNTAHGIVLAVGLRPSHQAR